MLNKALKSTIYDWPKFKETKNIQSYILLINLNIKTFPFFAYFPFCCVRPKGWL